MRDQQRSRYVERIERTVNLLQRALDAGEVPGLARLAREAGMSEYHFHRVYRLLTGETPQETTTRLRLAGSLPALARGGLAGGADASGYSTEQAYHRAVKAHTGDSPGALRRDPARLQQAAQALSLPPTRAGAPAALKIQVSNLEPLRLLAIRNVGDYTELNSGYGALFELLGAQLEPADIVGIYGLPLDDPRFTPAAECRFECAFDTGTRGAAAGPVHELRIAGGVHASLEHRGDFDLLHALVDELYLWVLERDLPIAQRPLFIHYLDDPDVTPAAEQRAIVHLPLEAQTPA